MGGLSGVLAPAVVPRPTPPQPVPAQKTAALPPQMAAPSAAPVSAPAQPLAAPPLPSVSAAVIEAATSPARSRGAPTAPQEATSQTPTAPQKAPIAAPPFVQPEPSTPKTVSDAQAPIFAAPSRLKISALYQLKMIHLQSCKLAGLQSHLLKLAADGVGNKFCPLWMKKVQRQRPQK